ncbi:hypothetical protein [Aliiglaciecola litoralis]|uniref:DUF4337 domain-containing protein n=1 Tax=Aliiglaciecola litoralis TaxID=582857 RepID=A0ABP3WTU2_9ALTE
MESIRNSKIAQLTIVAVISLFVVSVATWYSQLAANPENEYSQAYQEKSQKGFLTEEEVSELKALESSHLSDKKARAQRMQGYFGALVLSMIVMSLSFFWVKYKALVSLNAFIIGATTFLIALVVTGGVKQSTLWCVFSFIGAYAAEYIKHKKVHSG